MRPRSNPVYCSVDTTDLVHATRLIQSIAGGPRPAVGGIKLGLEFFLAHGAPGVRYAFPTPVRARSYSSRLRAISKAITARQDSSTPRRQRNLPSRLPQPTTPSTSRES